MTPQCPVCHGPLVIGGEGATEDITLYYWCPYCGEARDPERPESGQAAAITATGEGEGNMRTNRRFHEDRTQHGAREAHG
jgi:hypothetical protein